MFLNGVKKSIIKSLSVPDECKNGGQLENKRLE